MFVFKMCIKCTEKNIEHYVTKFVNVSTLVLGVWFSLGFWRPWTSDSCPVLPGSRKAEDQCMLDRHCTHNSAPSKHFRVFLLFVYILFFCFYFETVSRHIDQELSASLNILNRKTDPILPSQFFGRNTFLLACIGKYR